MSLLLSLLFLLLHVAIVLLAAALIWWALRFFGIALDPLVLKICQFIIAVIIIILIVSWVAGVVPSRGLFGQAPPFVVTTLALK